MRAALPLLVLAGLAACGPIPREAAERQCFERARLAAHPRGEVAVGVGTGGPSAGLEVTVSSDYLQGRDPANVYSNCVVQRSGELPSTPLYDRPDWTG